MRPHVRRDDITFVVDDVILIHYAPGGLHLSKMPVSWFYGK